MKKTLLVALVLAPLTLSFSGCAGKKIKRLEADLLACRESRTKLIQQQRSELDAPGGDAVTEEETEIDAEKPIPASRRSPVALAAHIDEECGLAPSDDQPL